MHCNEESLSEALEDVCDDYANMSAFDTDEDEENECGCGYESNMHMFPDNLTLAQSYVPMQYLDKTFKPCIGLKHGTIFPELVSPYKPCQSIEEIEFIKATNTMGKGCSW
jgi:hypothetical protein